MKSKKSAAKSAPPGPGRPRRRRPSRFRRPREGGPRRPRGLPQPQEPRRSRWDNGVFERFQHPVLTYRHAAARVALRFQRRRPTRISWSGSASTRRFNPGAILRNGKVHLVVRVEGADRKSFFALAESPNGVDHFRFWDEPCAMPELASRRRTSTTCASRCTRTAGSTACSAPSAKDPNAAAGRPLLGASPRPAWSAPRTSRMGAPARPEDPASQQRNVVLHPEFVGGQYAFYTRPMDGFIDVGSGGGIGWTPVPTSRPASPARRRSSNPAPTTRSKK